MKKIIYVPADDNHKGEFEIFEKSLRKFHSPEEIELIRWSDVGKDPKFFYRAKPVIADRLFTQGYGCVIGADSDQIVLGNLDHLWSEEDFDVATVLNDPSYKIGVWDVQPYFNNGLVVMKNHDFVKHWLRLCLSPHFDRYQFREQDMLNILCSDYLNYKVRCLDLEGKIHGEYAKPAWNQARVEGDKVMIDNKQLMLIHFGGGAESPNKGNYRIRFQEPVIKFIDEVIK